MPYAALAPLHWYGPACAAMVVTDSTGELLEAHPRRDIKPSLTVVGTGDSPVFRPYRGYAAALDVSGNAYMQVTPHQYKKISLTVNVGAVPSAEDIAQAIWNSVASNYNYAGTMGNKLNSAGSGGVDTGAIADEVVAGIVAAPSTLTVGKFLGLK